MARYNEMERLMGREGKSLRDSQGMNAQSWLPNGPDETRPPRLPRQRLNHTRKLGQRIIKHMQFCRTPAAGDSLQVAGDAGLVALFHLAHVS